MQGQSTSQITVAKVKQRLNKILEQYFKGLTILQKKQKKLVLVLNQPLLEEWYEILIQMVYFKDQKTIPSKPIQTIGSLKEQHSIQKYTRLPAPVSDEQHQNVVCNWDSNSLQVFQLIQKTRNGFSTKKSSIKFKEEFIHRFSSYTNLDSETLIMIGGSFHSDPNIKNRDVLKLNLISQQIVKIAELPYEISSHATVLVGNQIYIVGGNKNHNIVTKKCLKLSLFDRKVEKIANLNYQSASHSLLNWKNTFIYKIGGIGSCFGEWDLSPYIERYDIQEDYWEVINPKVKINQNLLHHYSLLVNSLVYLSNHDSIVVLGGFDLQQKGSRKVFEIQVRTQEIQGQLEYLHEIVGLGEVLPLQPGGFLSQQTVTIGAYLFAGQTIDDPKYGSNFKVVSISPTEIQYLEAVPNV